MRLFEYLAAACMAGGALGFPLNELFARDVVPSQGDVDFSKMFDGDTSATTLQPVSDTNSTVLSKRGPKKFNLKDQITLQWKNEDAFARIIADYVLPDEKVINMEDFGDELQNVDCTPPKMFMDFKHKDAFEAAKQQWGWVNEKENHHFILFVNHEKCGPKNQRIPYNVTKIQYDDKKFIANMVAQKIDFKAAVHTGKLRVEAKAQPVGPPTNATVTPRWRLSESGSIYHSMNGNIFSINNGANSVSLDCTDCGTEGYMGVAFDAAWGVKSWWPPSVGITHAYFEFWGTNVAARLNLALSGQTTGGLGGSKKLFSFQIFGLEIPGIMRLGFGPEFGVGYSVNLNGGGKVTWGARAWLTPSSYYRLCLTGCSSTSVGWGIGASASKAGVVGAVHGGSSVFGYTALSAGASIFGYGYQAGAAARAPDLNAQFNTITGNNVCGNPAAHKGLTAVVSAGLQTYAYAGTNPITPSNKWPIWSWYGKILDMCYPL